MTRQLDELRLWMSSLDPRQRLFENQPNEAERAVLDSNQKDDQKA